MTDNTISFDIDQKMLIFDKYLDRSNMDKKQYQYDGVAWCLRNELQPLKKVDPNLLLGKVEKKEEKEDPLKKVDKIKLKCFFKIYR